MTILKPDGKRVVYKLHQYDEYDDAEFIRLYFKYKDRLNQHSDEIDSHRNALGVISDYPDERKLTYYDRFYPKREHVIQCGLYKLENLEDDGLIGVHAYNQNPIASNSQEVNSNSQKISLQTLGAYMVCKIGVMKNGQDIVVETKMTNIGVRIVCECEKKYPMTVDENGFLLDEHGKKKKFLGSYYSCVAPFSNSQFLTYEYREDIAFKRYKGFLVDEAETIKLSYDVWGKILDVTILESDGKRIVFKLYQYDESEFLAKKDEKSENSSRDALGRVCDYSNDRGVDYFDYLRLKESDDDNEIIVQRGLYKLENPKDDLLIGCRVTTANNLTGFLRPVVYYKVGVTKDGRDLFVNVHYNLFTNFDISSCKNEWLKVGRDGLLFDQSGNNISLTKPNQTIDSCCFSKIKMNPDDPLSCLGYDVDEFPEDSNVNIFPENSYLMICSFS